MIRAWSAEDVRAAEQVAVAGLPDGRLMRRAAKGLAQVLLTRLEERKVRRVVVLVGPGNNGADALYAAARVSARGFSVVAVRGEWEVHEQALLRAKAAGVVVVEAHEGGSVLAEADLVVDGILGIGGRPGLPDQPRAWVDAIPEQAYVLAVDVPSGQDVDGHEPARLDAVVADETVTFGAVKPVHLLPGLAHTCGRLGIVDIGLELPAASAKVERLEQRDVAALWPVPGPADDKYSRGVVGVVAGGEDYTGAALLCTTAAVCSGAGMVRYVGTGKPTALVRAMVPEAVTGAGQVQAWVIGPGLDVRATGSQAAAQLASARRALGSDLPVVVDAGGLDLLECPRAAPTLLTPHAGECARLLARLDAEQITREQVAASPTAYARRLADRLDATVLLKGAVTVVVDPSAAGTPVRSQADAPPWLATAGSGDVLAGVCGTLLAAGLEPRDAGSLAALVHGVAGDRANPGGPVRARAIAEALPETIAGLLRRDG